jgi:hypothetical protein
MKKYIQENTPLGQPSDNGDKYSLLIIILALMCLLIIQSLP